MPQPFASLDGLVRLSHTAGVDIRRPLLRVLTDLYVQEKNHTREEEQQFVVLALRLIPAVDIGTRAAVARKLAAYSLAPKPVLEALSQAEPEVAAIIPANKESALGIGEESTDPAAERIAAEPASLPPNNSVEFRRERESSAQNGERVLSLGERFLATDSPHRETLLQALAREPGDADAVTITLPARPGAAHRLERAALQRNQQEFARELQLSLGITGRTAWRITRDERGEPVVVAARALGIESAVFLRIILFLNARIGESVERVFTLMRLHKTVEQSAVSAIVTSWREHASVLMGAPFQPVHATADIRDLRYLRENVRTQPSEPAERRRQETS